MKAILGLAFLLVSFLVKAQDDRDKITEKVFNITLVNAAQPLFIVDGIKRPRGLDPKAVPEINPNDIEKIDVVKGKTASLLYGEDGRGGVIVITTKKGKLKKSE